MEPLLERVRDICDDIAAEERSVATKRKRLRRAIRDAYQAGYSMQEIADAAGLSRQRVSKLIGKVNH